MKKVLVILCSLFLIFGFVALASADVILFSDNFDSENVGVGTLNYNSFTNWTVSDGTVDLIGNGYFDFLPGNGLYVDMDGSSWDAGKMTSTALVLDPGNYVLEFELAGNQRDTAGETVTVQVAMGSLFSHIYSLNQYDPFTLYSVPIIVASATTVNISFEGSGSDNYGMLLDDVKFIKQDVPQVPEPSSLLLIGLGLIGLAGFRRKV